MRTGPSLAEEPVADSDSDSLYEDARSGTPSYQLSPSSVVTESPHDGLNGSMPVEQQSPQPTPLKPLESLPPVIPPTSQTGEASSGGQGWTSQDGLCSAPAQDSNVETSDTDLTSLSHPNASD